jgi:hypothetical protein
VSDVNQQILVKLSAIDNLTPVMLQALQAMEAQTGRLADALNRLESPVKDLETNTRGLNAGLLNLAAGWTLLKDGVELAHKAYEKIAAQFEHAIDEAGEAEKVQNQLTGALVSTGQYTQALSDKVENYSNELERANGISGEQTKTLIAQATQMGLSVDKALEMEKAARMLGAATGGTAADGFSLLQGAMSGNARALGKILPQVKELSEAQLKQGGAVGIVTQALKAQYDLYQGSFAAGVAKAKNALSNVYEATGNIIIQNPLVKKALDAFTSGMVQLQSSIESVGKWVEANQQVIEDWTVSVVQVLKVGAVALGAWAIAAGAAAIATGGLAAAVALVASPVTLAVGAAVALSAAFKAYPDLFDKVMGGLKMMVAAFLDGFGTAATYAAKLAGIFNQDLATSLNSVSGNLKKQADAWGEAGARQIQYAGTAQATAATVEAAGAREVRAIDQTLAAESRRRAAIKATQDTYAGFLSGNVTVRQALEEEAQARDKALKNFEAYTQNKMRLAVTKEAEEQTALARIRASLLTSGGPEARRPARTVPQSSCREDRQQRLLAARREGYDQSGPARAGADGLGADDPGVSGSSPTRRTLRRAPRPSVRPQTRLRSSASSRKRSSKSSSPTASRRPRPSARPRRSSRLRRSKPRKSTRPRWSRSRPATGTEKPRSASKAATVSAPSWHACARSRSATARSWAP